MRLRNVARSALLAVLAACSVELGVDRGAQVSCSDNADCPPGFRCKGAVGRCFQIGADDVLPAVVDATVSPPRISGNVAVTIHLEMSEALAKTPQVRLGSPERQSATPTTQPSALTYEFTLSVSGDDTPGAWPVLADLVDASGNAVENVAVGTVILDFTDPEITVAWVEYTPDTGNVLQRVGALRNGSTAQIGFTVSESLGALSLRAVCGSDTLPITIGPPDADQLLFTAALPLGAGDVAVDGTCYVVADVTDTAQNRVMDAQVTTVLIDRTPPNDADVQQSELLHARFPWGATQTGGVAAQFLTSSSLAAGDDPATASIPRTAFESAGEELWEVRIFDDASGLRQIGTLFPDPGGWPSSQLGLIDSRRIYVQLVDQAGNTSGIVPVDQGRWLATMNRKIAGEVYDNPHAVGSYPDAAEVLPSDADLRTPLFASAAAEAGAAPSTSTSGYTGLSTTSALSWRHGPRRTGQPQEPSIAAYDRARDRVVLVGGEEMWIYQRDGWDRIFVPLPPNRVDAAMVYDPQRDRVVLFGGEAYDAGTGRTGIHLDDTWEWDGFAWNDRSPLASPVPRARHGMVYDERLGRVVILGGEGDADCDGSGSTACTGVWQWDGADWTALPGSPPGPRLFPAMGFDSEQMRLIVHGGMDPATSGCSLADDPCACASSFIYTDTWRYDTTGWTELVASGPQVSSAQLTFDEARHRGVLVGCRQVYELDGDVWDSRCDGMPAGDTCRTPAEHGLMFVGQAQSYDPVRRRTLVYGGLADSGEGNLDQGIAWNGRDWSQDLSWLEGDVPGDLVGASLVYDSLRERTILFGGLTNRGVCRGGSLNSICQDTWTWDGTTWTYVATPTKPDHVSRAAMAFDPVRGVTVLFMSVAGTAATWTFDGSDWTDLALASAAMPPARTSAAMAWDPIGERIILFGGYHTDCSTGDTWEWTGSAWNDLALGVGPTSRSSHAMATDLERGRIVLYGGTAACGSNPGPVGAETWEFDGTQWLQAATTGPPPRYSLAMAYDAARRRVETYGGYTYAAEGCDGTGNRYCDTSWSWDGAVWTQLDRVDPDADGNPPPSRAGAMVFHAATSELVLIAGEAGDSLTDTSGSWSSRRSPSPAAQLARIDLAAASVPHDAMTGLSVTWEGGAHGWHSDTLVLHDGSDGTNLVRTYDAASPPVDALTQLDGRRLDGLWHLYVRDRTAGNAAVINGWCVDTNATHGGPFCASPAQTLSDRGSAWLTLDLRGEASTSVNDVAVSVDITHADASELEVGLVTELPVAGAALYTWSRGRWYRQNDNLAAVDARQPLTWTDAEQGPAAWLFGDVLNLAVVPTASDPTALGSAVRTGSLEVTLDYVLTP